MNIMLEEVATADMRQRSEGVGRGSDRRPAGQSVISPVGQAGIEDRDVVMTGTGLPCRVRGDFDSRRSSSYIYFEFGFWVHGVRGGPGGWGFRSGQT